MSNRLEIPVMHCFDDNYSAPAAVAFLTMLETASPDAFYKIYVVHKDISPKHREMLTAIVNRFPNASIEFIVPKIDVSAIWKRVSSKAHFSKDVIYKLVVADIFPKLDKIVIADVDVLYRDDIGKVYRQFLNNVDDYIYGCNYGKCGLIKKWTLDSQYKQFNGCELQALKDGVGGGFLVCNLDLMRKDDIPRKAIAFLADNAGRLWQLEQDVLNIVCRGKIAYMPAEALICAYLFDVLGKAEKVRWRDVLEHPIQLHYATAAKPWTEPGSQMSHVWWDALLRTPFFYEVASKFNARIHLHKDKYALPWAKGLPFVKVMHGGLIKSVRLFGMFDLVRGEYFWKRTKR